MIRSIIIFIIFTIQTALAEDVSVKAYLSQSNISLGSQFQYTLEIQGASVSASDITFPDLNAFFVLAGPNTSSSVQIINGAMSSSRTYSFYLQPKEKGSFTIGPAAFNHKGQNYASNSLTVTVGSSNAPAQQGENAPTNDSDDTRNLFLKTEVSKRQAVVGEQLIVEYKLYFRLNVRGYNVDKMPANTGFWSEDFEMPAQPVIDSKVIDGLNYNVAVLKKVALFPTQAGPLEIQPLQLTVEALAPQQRRRSQSVFDSFFDDPFGRTVRRTVTSPVIKIDVQPTPAAGKPANFSGAVGRFDFSAALDKNQVPANEAVSLKLKLSGQGNIKLAELPVPELHPDLERYDPKFDASINSAGNAIQGSKSAEYVLIPRLPGAYTIPALSFTFFDPQTRQYKSVQSAPIGLTVTPGSGPSGTVTSAPSASARREVMLLGKDIRFIKNETIFIPAGHLALHNPVYWLTLILPGLLFLLGSLYLTYQGRLNANQRLLRRKQAGKMAMRALTKARKNQQSADSALFYRELTAALEGFVKDKMSIDLSDFRVDEVRRQLQKREVGAELIEAYAAVLEQSHFGQFAPAADNPQTRQNLLDAAADVLTRLEKLV